MPSARQQDVTACALVAGLFDSGMYSLEELRDALAPAYRVDTELRQEGIGQRLLARDADEGPVMITALSHSLAHQMSAEAFVHSMRQTMIVRHPGLLPLLHAGRTSGGITYFVTPFPDGPSAQDRVRDRGVLAASAVAAVGRRVLAALASLHVAGLIHGRINARAVYVTADGAVLADHGVYQALIGAGVPAAALLAAYGTSSHVSPEQVAGELADERSDVYALGATLYELLTGKPPFGGRTTSATLVTVLSDETGENVGGAQTPGHVSRAILRAIEKLPDDRWQTAEAFGSALAENEGPRPRGKSGCLPATLAMALVAAWLAH